MFKRSLQLMAYAVLAMSSLTTQAENTTFNTSHFSGSGNCSMCHDNLTDTSGDDVSIVRDWGASMMSNSAKDPFWRAKVATELDRNPHLSSVINDKCTKCHAPIANYEINKVQGGELSLFGPDGVLNPNHVMYDEAMNGVSCTVCHQITDDAALGTLEGFSGEYKINDTRTIYGQFADIFGQPMINNTGYTPTYSAHVSDSALCASCHNLKTPYVDAQGNVLTTTPDTEFPEQMPYTEWQNSIFDDAGANPQSCQDCHMPKTTSKVSNRPRWLGTKNGFAKHHLVGANTTMLTLLRDNAAALDVISNDLDTSISRARAMLQSAASVEITSASVTDGVLEAQVRIQNSSGHKTPTAYPSRRMWLNFKVTDSDNNVVFESGAINADGSITGADNDVDQSVFEPHYDVITAADQVQIYETIMGDSDGNVTYTLLRGAQYLKDNRVTPQGFDKFSVPSDVAVHGQAMNDSDFNQGSDEVTYRISVAASGELTVSVSLNYQTIAHGFLQDLYRDNQLQQVQDFKAMYDAQSLKHEQITSTQTTVVSDGGGNPSPVPTASISASPATIDQGQSATISWNSTDATSCTATGGWSGARSTTGSESVSPSATTSYTLTCNGDGGSANDSVTVTVNEPPATVPTVNVTMSPSTIDQGQSATISWNSADATSCTASGGWSGARSTSGSESVSPTATTSYTLTCSGEGGSANDSVTVTVNEPPVPVPTVDVTVSPSTIDKGQSATINWSSTDATSCTASGGWSGSRGSGGTESVSPTATTTYTLNCSGAGGSANDSVTVIVNQPPVATEPTVNLSASPSRIRRGDSITLSWSSTDATSCTASGSWSGSKSTSGSQSVTLSDPGTLTLTCTGEGGSTSSSVTYGSRGRRWLELQ
jgi:Zn-finger protein